MHVIMFFTVEKKGSVYMMTGEDKRTYKGGRERGIC
jgi:hypothetical protein